MKIDLNYKGLDMALTDEHPASSYGQAVLVVAGNAYGRFEAVPGAHKGDALPAWYLVDAAVRQRAGEGKPMGRAEINVAIAYTHNVCLIDYAAPGQ